MCARTHTHTCTQLKTAKIPWPTGKCSPCISLLVCLPLIHSKALAGLQSGHVPCAWPIPCAWTIPCAQGTCRVCTPGRPRVQVPANCTSLAPAPKRLQCAHLLLATRGIHGASVLLSTTGGHRHTSTCTHITSSVARRSTCSDADPCG